MTASQLCDNGASNPSLVMGRFSVLSPDMVNFPMVVGWIGIAAFVLAIPMAVCANLLTPKVLNF